MITDGEQTTKKGPYTKLDAASKYLKDKGVLVYALGIGSKVKMEELRLIASNDRTVFAAASFDELAIKVKTIVKRICSDGMYAALLVILFFFIHDFISVIQTTILDIIALLLLVVLLENAPTNCLRYRFIFI